MCEEYDVTQLCKQFMNAILLNHLFDYVAQSLDEHVIGIGMGSQGIVSCKADVI